MSCDVLHTLSFHLLGCCTALPSRKGGQAEGGGGAEQICDSEKTRGMSPWGSGGSLVSHVHAEGWSKGHVCGLTGYKCSFTEANLEIGN